MGLLDGLKKFGNMLTGGGAKVTLEIINPTLTGEFLGKIKAVISDADLKIAKVYLKVAGVEKVIIKNVSFPNSSGSTSTSLTSATKKDLEESAFTYQNEIKVTDAITLTAKQEYNWDVKIQLPANALPTFQGINAKHEWQFLAGLDSSGNDPDSGWITTIISPNFR